jgi:serine/threonine-protein phosphatase 4 regulatory subunit 1
MAGENIHEDLIRCYLDIAVNTQTQNSMDSDTIFHCAYNFPAVLLTLGPERWPDLRVIYNKLASDS